MQIEQLEKKLRELILESEDDKYNTYINVLEFIKPLIIKERPSPFQWLKEEKFKIPQGATYISPKISMTQCAGWIAEYVDKYYKL